MVGVLIVTSESVFYNNIFICFHHQIYLQFEVIFYVKVFYTILSYSLPNGDSQ